MDSGNRSFDYIVVGGGTTGLVVASRLSEDPSITVAIVEAGSYRTNDDRINVPGFFGKTIGDPDFDWMLETAPQAHVNNRRLLLPRGRVLGGTSTINSMTWARASKQDYDALVELGNPGWGWDDWFPYMLKTETIHPSSDPDAPRNLATFDPKYHSTTGPIHLSFVPWLGITHQPFFASLNALGVADNPDSGSGSNIGNFTLVTSINPGDSTRCNSTTAYYEPFSHRRNLVLITNTHVRRILTAGPDKSGLVRAAGVEVRHNGNIHHITAKAEVIISAGSYMTPSLLELSGIGDSNRLKNLGIPLVVDLPGVGENLQDHLLVPCSFELKDQHETSDLLHDSEFAKQELERYKRSRQGQYASIHSAFSLLPATEFLKPAEVRAIEHTLKPNPMLSGPRSLHKQYSIQQRWLADHHHAQLELMHVPEYYTPGAGKPKLDGRYVSILCVLMHALSRGSVHIQSSDPLNKPHIDPNFLSHEADLKMLVQSLRFARKVANTAPLSDLIRSPIHPDPENIQSDKELEEYIKRQLETAHHPIGTASMLPRKDGGVVDPHLKVYGMSNLRVADASILPIHFSAHPQATLYALGEKAAELIRQDRQIIARSKL